MTTSTKPLTTLLNHAALALAILASSASAQGLTRDQVQAELAEARQSGDLITIHNGKTLPLKPFMSDYINEKLECIFSGAKVISTPVETAGT